MFGSRGKHVRTSAAKMVSSVGVIFALVAASFGSTVFVAQAAVTEEVAYCGFWDQEFSNDYTGTPSGINGNGLFLSRTDLTSRFAEADGLVSVTLNDGTIIETSNVYNSVVGVDEVTTFGFPENINKTTAEVWPVNIAYTFPTDASEDVVTDNVTFEIFQPCTGRLVDARTASTNDPFDEFGFLDGLTGPDSYSPITASSEVSKTTDTVTGEIVYTFISENFLSEDSTAEVDVHVEITFSGNTVTWSVSAFEPGTSVPSQLTFRISGNLGSDQETVFTTSNGKIVSTDASLTDGSLGDTPIVYHTDGTMSYDQQSDDVKFDFASGSESGFMQVTLLGFERCATVAQVNSSISDFTNNYASRVNTEIAEVQGVCERSCSPSDSAIELSEGTFNLADVEICFDKGYNSGNLDLLDQVESDDDLGNELTVGMSVDYQDVAAGSDKSLNAILTVSEIIDLEDDFVYSIDALSSNFAKNPWIRTNIHYLESSSERFVKYSLVFYDSEDMNKTPVTVSNLSLSVYDIDQYQFFEVSNVRSFALSNDTILTTSTVGSNGVRAAEMSNESSSDGDESRITVNLSEASEYVIRLGMSGFESEASNATFGLDFSGGEPWEEAPEEVLVSNSGSVRQSTPPAMPTKPRVTITPGSGSLNVAISYTGQSKESPTAYTIFASPSGNSCVAMGATSSCDILGLKPGVEYTISIEAVNSAGSSGFYVTRDTYKLTSTSAAEYRAKRTIDNFPGDSPKLLRSLKTKIKKFVTKHPEITNFTCTGYTAGPVKKSDKVLAKSRASNVCAYVEKIKPSVSATTIGKTPGLPLRPANRKVVIRGYSATS